MPASVMLPRSSTQIRSACMIVDSRWAIRIVMTSWLVPTSRIVWPMSSSVSESRDEVASSNTRRCGRRRRARAIDRRCFSRESYEHGFTRDAVWLVVPDSLRAGITATVPGYVIVEGTFQADYTDLGLFLLTTGPTVQVLAAAQKRDDSEEELNLPVPPGDYYVLVMDQGGASARYGICMAIGSICAVPAVAPVPAIPAVRSELDRALRHLDRAGQVPTRRGRR